jgi:hypothetical protein
VDDGFAAPTGPLALPLVPLPLPTTSGRNSTAVYRADHVPGPPKLAPARKPPTIPAANITAPPPKKEDAALLRRGEEGEEEEEGKRGIMGCPRRLVWDLDGRRPA